MRRYYSFKDMMNIDKDVSTKISNGKNLKGLKSNVIRIATKPEDDDIILDFFAGSGRHRACSTRKKLRR